MSWIGEERTDGEDNGARPARTRRRNVTRLGFVGLVDAAPLFVAVELGLFEQRGLNVVLTREIGWATVKEKIAFGELEAAHALCPLPFASSASGSVAASSCISGLMLSRGGNAIALSEELWTRGVRDQPTLRMDVENRKAFRKYIFATVHPCSTHAFLLRDWLKGAGLNPSSDVQLVTLPPTQMCRNLAAGTIDGFCAGEPWPSLAISQGIAWSPAASVDISPDHPEKCVMVRERFALEHPEEHVELLAAIIEGCAICDEPQHWGFLAELMSDRRRVNCSADLLKECLSPIFNYGMGRVERKPGFARFFAGDANRPSRADADWILDRMPYDWAPPDEAARERLKARVFREDIYEEARAQAQVGAALRRAGSAFALAK